MKSLEEKILSEGKVLPGNILKVDHFLNHQIDVDLLMEMGRDFYDHFKGQEITKILTLEVSGIAVAFAAATYFKVPVVFAKKTTSLTLGEDVYTSNVYSHTKQMAYDIKVNKEFLKADDKVLIFDDFLANGKALDGLVDLCMQSGAQVQGIGIAIEKVFQKGGERYREKGFDLYSQAMIKEFKEDTVTFA